ncbi:MAG: GH92 family glycosyl hydrolase [Bacteroidales bacterium]|nr:GH92 family glycosyl hydrolase [Bacteroidales bacterium]
MKKILFGAILILFIISCSSEKEKQNDSKPINKTQLSDYVNPFIGTAAHGHTYPGPAMPFGMVQLGPDTKLTGWDGSSGYHYDEDTIYGFSHTHLSGTGVGDYCDVLFMPTVGKETITNGYNSSEEGYCSVFSHNNEKASPGYYSVMLDDYNVLAELTVTKRTGFHRYTFPESDNSNIVIDLNHRDKVLESYIEIISETEIAGYRKSKDWADSQYVFFVAKFSKPIKSYKIAKDLVFVENQNKVEGLDIRALIQFETKKDEQILVKVGLSAVSAESARENLDSEIKDWDFDQIHKNARNEWEKELSKIKVKGGSEEQKITFYSALYHSFLNPNLFQDVNGKYRGRDLNIHSDSSFTNYTVFSLWDTYRATHPLFTIIQREKTLDFIKTFIKQYENGGLLPVWELAANETFCMIGYHSVPVIVDAWFKGIRDFDVEKAFEAMKKSSNMNHFGLEDYRKYGYVLGSNECESVSKTLEYAYDDWCIAMMAKDLGKEDDYKEYIQRAQNYKNVFDPNSQFMVAKMNQQWFSPFDPKEVNFNYTEANSWQYSFYVPQDISGLIELHGGKEKLEAKLDEMFSASTETTGRQQSDITGLIGQYAHGNEPSHHMAYLYNFLNKPHKTQEMVRKIMAEQYSEKPDGLCGNEDCGQMSAWYVFSAMGFYPVTPGSTNYIIGSPIFEEIEIALENGKKFVIKANNLSEKNKYINSAKLNGKDYKNSYITHNDIINGGELIFEMSDKANNEFGIKDENIPFSTISENLIQEVPFVAEGTRTFLDKTEVKFGTISKDAQIFYTTDGSEPGEKSIQYTKPIILTKSQIFKIKAFSEGKIPSKTVVAEFNKIPKGRTISLATKYANQYSAGGDFALIDYIKGTNNFRTGTWQGYEDVNMDVTIDLGSIQPFNEISVGFIKDVGAWIFFPKTVTIRISPDGSKFETIKVVNNKIIDNDYSVDIQRIAVGNPYNKKTRYVKIIAENAGVCPNWHKGAGGKTWIFSDEIEIK